MRTHGRQLEWGLWFVAVVAMVSGARFLTAGGVQSPARVQVLAVETTPTLALEPAEPRSIPLLLRIPSLGIVAHVSSLGVQPNATIMVPTTVTGVGWYRYGPTPGEAGSSVLLGHVDSYRGPGVFVDLKRLRAGASIYVRLANGAITRFRVHSVIRYPKSAFPDALVYKKNGRPGLTLVTCGGRFNFVTRHYDSNVVVFSDYQGLVTAHS